MIISFAIDVSGTIDNCTAYILFRPQSKKIVNNIVDIGTSLALLSDTDIINPQNGQVPQYNSISGKWENKNIDGYTYKSLYRWNSAANG